MSQARFHARAPYHGEDAARHIYREGGDGQRGEAGYQDGANLERKQTHAEPHRGASPSVDRKREDELSPRGEDEFGLRRRSRGVR